MTRKVCTSIRRDDVFARYVQDTLGPEERDAFEEHFFTCEACFEKLQTFQAIQAQLGARPVEAPAAGTVRSWRLRWVLAPVAAGLILLTAVALWPPGRTPEAPRSTVAEAPRQQPQAPAAQVPTREPAAEPRLAPATPGRKPETPAARPSAPAPLVALTVLARVEPPAYIPLSLRGPRSEAAARFDAAMRRYVARDYRGAIPDLTAATRLSPDGPHAVFFLAICHLLTDQLDAAIAGLQDTVALGESPYLEEAHFYLAKARLRQGDVRAAQAELKRTIGLRGQLEADARRLLAQVEAHLRER